MADKMAPGQGSHNPTGAKPAKKGSDEPEIPIDPKLKMTLEEFRELYTVEKLSTLNMSNPPFPLLREDFKPPQDFELSQYFQLPRKFAPMKAAETSHSGAKPSKVLLVIPTNNEAKIQALKTYLTGVMKGSGYTLDTRKVTVHSGVGKQPYDTAGPAGAFNRVCNAVKKLAATWRTEENASENAKYDFVIVGAIESFFLIPMLENGEEPQPLDYGIVVFYKVPIKGKMNGGWVINVSQGIEVPRPYFDHARKLGFKNNNPLHGAVTASNVMQAHVEGLDPADWHKELMKKEVARKTGFKTRYDLLSNAMDAVECDVQELLGLKTDLMKAGSGSGKPKGPMLKKGHGMDGMEIEGGNSAGGNSAGSGSGQAGKRRPMVKEGHGMGMEIKDGKTAGGKAAGEMAGGKDAGGHKKAGQSTARMIGRTLKTLACGIRKK